MVPVRNLGLRKYKVGRKFLNKLCHSVYGWVEQNTIGFINLVLGADHLTLEGGGGGVWWVISGQKEFFFIAILWAGYFFPFFPLSFLLHLCWMQFFSSDKCFQEFFFKITRPSFCRKLQNKLRVFAARFTVAWDRGFSAFPANRQRQEVSWPRPCRRLCGLRFAFVWLDLALEVSDLQQGFPHPKHHNLRFEKNTTF